MLVSHFGNIIKNRRKLLGVSQPELSDMAGVSINTLSKLEKGEGNPTLDVLAKLAEVLGLELRLEVKKQI